MLVVGYHVAKTGGTTVMHHIINNMGEQAYFGYGNHPSMTRFFQNQPLWEELTHVERDPVKFIFGHHVNDMLLTALGNKTPALFTVIRDPFTHFVSQYKHHLSVIKGEGRYISARDYFKNWKANRVSSEFHKFFPNLHPDVDPPFREDVIFYILKQFQFLCATEHLTEQSRPICDGLNIPAIEGRYRVSANEVDLEGITPEEVYERSPIDRKIHQAVMQRASGEASLLDFDRDAFGESLERINGKFTKAQTIRSAYERLAHFFCARDIIEAAQLHLALQESYEKQHIPILRANARQNSMIWPKAIARSEKEQAMVFMQHQNFVMARACFEKAITLNPQFIDAYVGYIECLTQLKDHDKVCEVSRYVLEELDPKNTQAHTVLKKLGR